MSFFWTLFYALGISYVYRSGRVSKKLHLYSVALTVLKLIAIGSVTRTYYEDRHMYKNSTVGTIALMAGWAAAAVHFVVDDLMNSFNNEKSAKLFLRMSSISKQCSYESDVSEMRRSRKFSFFHLVFGFLIIVAWEISFWSADKNLGINAVMHFLMLCVTIIIYAGW